MKYQCSRCKGITNFPLTGYRTPKDSYDDICIDCYNEVKHNWFRI